MYYYEVAPATRQYNGFSPLTYHSGSRLARGQVIVVKIRRAFALGIVTGSVNKPGFATKPVEEIYDIKLSSVHLRLLEWLCSYYPAGIGVITQLFLPQKMSEKDLQRAPDKRKDTKPQIFADILPPLSQEQQNIISFVHQNKPHSAVLHGDTGTGKTRVYLELAQSSLTANKSVLVLTPEIALTPQLVNSFRAVFKNRVLVTHSGITPVQRKALWLEAYESGGPKIVIGPRSALFMPLKSIGLIVVDEFHETAYKQEQSPYYQTLRVASKLAELHKSLLIFGSATPPVNEYFLAEQKKIPILRMTTKPLKIDASKEPSIKTVNLNDENENTGNPLLSKTLIRKIAQALENKDQVLLFLNKRGSSRLILCQNCGWHADCERCNLSFTYHADKHQLNCHTCGNTKPTPTNCPKCGSVEIVFKSPGTKSIVDSLSKIFPSAKIARFDKDNLKHEKIEQRHEEIIKGDIDIIVGTQLLAKGHDLPKLGLVGVLFAENGLQFPDYTAEERSYQLIHQLIGRVDRGHKKGTVVIQAYNPTNLAIKTAIGKETWLDFYHRQLEERKLFRFPPFHHVLKIETSRSTQASAQNAAERIAASIRARKLPVEVVGPSPSFIEKRNNKWVWQLIVKSKQRSYIVEIAKSLPTKGIANLDPTHLL